MCAFVPENMRPFWFAAGSGMRVRCKRVAPGGPERADSEALLGRRPIPVRIQRTKESQTDEGTVGGNNIEVVAVCRTLDTPHALHSIHTHKTAAGWTLVGRSASPCLAAANQMLRCRIVQQRTQRENNTCTYRSKVLCSCYTITCNIIFLAVECRQK